MNKAKNEPASRERGIIRSDDVAVTMAGYALLGMCNWAYRWYSPAARLSPQAIADVFAKIALQGLTRA